MTLDQKRHMAAAGALIGVVVLAAGLYVLVTNIRFAYNAVPLEATIIAVSYESVAAGRGSKPAYVPIVQVPQLGAVKVETSSADNIYSVGTRMNIVCELSARKCVRDAFFDKWQGLVTLAIGLTFFVPAFVFLKRDRRSDQREPGDGRWLG